MLLHLLISGEGKDDEHGSGVFRPSYLRGTGTSLQGTSVIENWIPDKVSTNPITCIQDDRLFTTDPSLLLKPIPEIIGDRSEVVFLDGNKLKWSMVERVNRFPRGIVTFGRPCDPKYILHYRVTYPSGAEYYIKSAVVWSTRINRPHLATRHARMLCDKSQLACRNRELHFSIVTMASMLEDSQLFWKVSLSSDKTITVYADKGSIRDLCDLRDNPLSATGRRRPILHWVASHTRSKSTGADIDVRKHLRGITEFEMDGISVRVDAPEFEKSALNQNRATSGN